MKRKAVGIHPLMKQVIRAKWSVQGVRAQLHALIGANREMLLAQCSIFFSVACACALQLKFSDDEPDLRIVRASINALGDLAQHEQITESDRGALSSGLQAAARIIEASPVEVVEWAINWYDQQSQQWAKGAH